MNLHLPLEKADTKAKPRLKQFRNYLTWIKKSIKAEMFQNLYGEVDGEEIDLLGDGLVSCAVFVSTVLYLFKLVNDRRATVSSLVSDLESSGWEKTTKPIPGAVIIWEEARQAGGQLHAHAGFYMGDERAISHSDVERTPVEHHFTFNGKRAISAIYVHSFLG